MVIDFDAFGWILGCLSTSREVTQGFALSDRGGPMYKHSVRHGVIKKDKKEHVPACSGRGVLLIGRLPIPLLAILFLSCYLHMHEEYSIFLAFKHMQFPGNCNVSDSCISPYFQLKRCPDAYVCPTCVNKCYQLYNCINWYAISFQLKAVLTAFKSFIKDFGKGSKVLIRLIDEDLVSFFVLIMIVLFEVEYLWGAYVPCQKLHWNMIFSKRKS